jgi:hypothetical protein
VTRHLELCRGFLLDTEHDDVVALDCYSGGALADGLERILDLSAPHVNSSFLNQITWVLVVGNSAHRQMDSLASCSPAMRC